MRRPLLLPHLRTGAADMVHSLLGCRRRVGAAKETGRHGVAIGEVTCARFVALIALDFVHPTQPRTLQGTLRTHWSRPLSIGDRILMKYYNYYNSLKAEVLYAGKCAFMRADPSRKLPFSWKLRSRSPRSRSRRYSRRHAFE